MKKNNDGVVLTLFAIALIAAAVTHQSQAGTEKLYNVCYKNKANAPLICEPEKLNIEDAIQRCKNLLKKWGFCEVKEA